MAVKVLPPPVYKLNQQQPLSFKYFTTSVFTSFCKGLSVPLNLGKSIFYSSLISFISMIIFWFVFIIFLKIPFALKFLPFLLY